MFPLRTVGLVGLLVCVPCDVALGQGCANKWQPPTWRSEARSADLVAIGWITQNRIVDRDQRTGQSTFQVDRFVHAHPLPARRDTFTLDRIVPIDVSKPPQAYLVFAEVKNGKTDFYRGEPVSSPGAVKDYLTGLLAIDDNDVAQRIKYCFKHTGSAEPAVAEESFKELDAVAWADLVRFSRPLDHEKIRERLTDPNTKSNHLGALTLLLAGCGKKDDVAVIRNLLEPQAAGATPPGRRQFPRICSSMLF